MPSYWGHQRKSVMEEVMSDPSQERQGGFDRRVQVETREQWASLSRQGDSGLRTEFLGKGDFRPFFFFLPRVTGLKLTGHWCLKLASYPLLRVASPQRSTPIGIGGTDSVQLMAIPPQTGQPSGTRRTVPRQARRPVTLCSSALVLVLKCRAPCPPRARGCQWRKRIPSSRSP